MITQFRHVGIVTNNLEASLHFYKDLLGLKIRAESQEEGSFIETALGLKKVLIKTIKLMAAQRGGEVELLHYSSPESPERTPFALHERGISHFSLTIENLDQEYEKLIKEGIVFISPPQTAPGGRAKAAFCQDPDGNYIEFIEDLNKT